MGFQTSVNDNPDLFGPMGSRYGDGHAPERAYHNNETEVAGVWNAAYTYAAGQDCTLVVNGVYVVTPGNTDDATTATDALADAQGNSFLAGVAVFAAGAAGSITITEASPGSITSVTGSGGGAADITVTVTTASVDNDEFDGGIIIHEDSSRPGAAILPTAAPTGNISLAGVVAHRHRPIDKNAAAGSQYDFPAGSQVPVGYRGGYIMNCETALDPEDTIYYRITANSNGSQLGAIRNDADGGAAITLGTSAKALVSISAGGKVPVAFNLT